MVVIETKMPERGRLQLSYKGDFSITTADLTDYNLMNASEKLQFETLAGVYTDTNDMSNQLRLDNLRNERLKGIAQGIDTYWLSEPLRTGFTHKHNIYAEGGEEKIRYGIGSLFWMRCVSLSLFTQRASYIPSGTMMVPPSRLVNS